MSVPAPVQLRLRWTPIGKPQRTPTLGSVIRVRIDAMDELGAAIAVTGLWLWVRRPSGAVVKETAITADALGAYWIDITLDAASAWTFEAGCLGPREARSPAMALRVAASRTVATTPADPVLLDENDDPIAFQEGAFWRAKRIGSLDQVPTIQTTDDVVIRRGGVTRRVSGQALADAGAAEAIAGVTRRERFASDQAAADAAHGRMLVIGETAVVTIQVPGQFPTVQAALDACSRWVIPGRAIIRIEVTGIVSVAAAEIARIAQANAGQIELVGKSATITRTIQPSGHAVSGGPGNWTVTVKLDDVTGLAPGMMLLMREPRDTANQLRWMFDGQAGSVVGEVTTAGTALTLGRQQHDLLTTNHLVRINDNLLGVQARISATEFTLDAAPKDDVVEQIYTDFALRGAGTVATAGLSDILLGTGADWLSRSTPGDIIMVREANRPIFARVTEVTAEGQQRIDRPLNLPAGTQYAMHCMAEMHVGAFPILSVDPVARTVTYLNTVNATIPLGPNQLKGGTVRVLPDVLRNTQSGGNGLVGGSGNFLKLIDRLGIVGGGGNGIAIAADGLGRDADSLVNLGEFVGVSHWAQAINVTYGNAHADWLCAGNFTGASNGPFGLHAYQGDIYARHARISGGGNYAAFMGTGGSIYCANAVFAGWNIAIYLSAGGSVYADGPRLYGTRSNGVQGMAASAMHLVEIRGYCVGSIVVSFNSGSGGRYAGGHLLCTGAAPGGSGIGVSANQAGGIEGSYALMGGGTGLGYSGSGTACEMTWATLIGNLGGGALANGGDLDIRFAFIARNGAAGILGTGGADVKAASTRSRDNAGADYQATGPTSEVGIAGRRDPLSTVSPPLNLMQGGAVVHDGGLRTSGIITATVQMDFPSIAPGAEAPLDFAMAGVEARDEISLGPPNNGQLNGRILMMPLVLSPGVVRVHARNLHNVAVDLTNLVFVVTARRAG